jgi:hypothetical protein
MMGPAPAGIAVTAVMVAAVMVAAVAAMNQGTSLCGMGPPPQ